MRGITTAVFLVCMVLVVAAAPKSSNSQQWGKNVKNKVDGSSAIYPSDRTRPSSPSPRKKSEGGPYLFFREPKALGRETGAWNGNSWVRGQDDGVAVQPQNPGYWPRYSRGRDDEESDEEEEDADDVADDVGDNSGSEEDDVAFDTPSWDSIYPPSETGGYARQNEASEAPSGSWHGKPASGSSQQLHASYSLKPGSPGGPSGYQGRSGFDKPRWSSQSPEWWSKNWSQGSGSRQVRRGPPPVFRRQQFYDQEIESVPWQGQRWSGNVVYAPRPQYVRRSWNYRPSVRRPVQEVDSDEDSGEGEQIWTQGPRHVVKNWARPQPQTWGPSPSQKFGYY